MTTVPSIIRQPGEGEVIHAYGDSVRLKLGVPDTGGLLSMGHLTTPPGGGPPLHRHTREDELFIIIEGRFKFVSDGQEYEAGPGTVAFLPRNSVHTFKVIGDRPGRAWVQVFPAGFEQFFRASAAIFAEAAGRPPDMARLIETAAAQGIEILGPPLE
jgi:quercetin dioxygenase-like cupin family protein